MCECVCVAHKEDIIQDDMRKTWFYYLSPRVCFRRHVQLQLIWVSTNKCMCLTERRLWSLAAFSLVQSAVQYSLMERKIFSFTLNYMSLPHFTWTVDVTEDSFLHFPTSLLWFPRGPNCKNLLHWQKKSHLHMQMSANNQSLCWLSHTAQAGGLPHHCSPSQHLEAQRVDKGISRGSGEDLWPGHSGLSVPLQTIQLARLVREAERQRAQPCESICQNSQELTNCI